MGIVDRLESESASKPRNFRFIGKTNGFLVQGNIYTLLGGSCTLITNEWGKESPISIHDKLRWIEVFDEEGGEMARNSIEKVEVDVPQQSGYVTPKEINMTLTKKEKHMNIENVTLINGVQTKDVSDESIIQAIEAEITKVDRLENLLNSVDSEAMERLVAKHKSNIKKLSEILDQRSK